MPTVTASVVGTGDSLETFRQQFNNLRTDVSGLSFSSTLIFEGSVADDFETTLSVTNPTADRTITIPDKSDTIALLGDLGDVVLLNGTDSSGTDAGDNLVLDGPAVDVGDQILFEDATGDHLENPAVRNEVDILLETSTFAKKDFLLDERDSDRIEFESATQDPLIGGLFVPPAGGGPQFTMPTSDGLANQILGTDGSGNLSFINQSSGLSLANDGNNRVITATGANSGNGEANLLFDGSTLTVTGNITVPDDGDIGSVSATNAIQISSGGIVTFVDDIKIKDGGTIGVASAADAMTISSAGIVTFKDDILIKDAGTIGSASDPDAISIGSDGDVTLTQDLELQHDGATVAFGSNDEITITHVHNSGLTITNTVNGTDDSPVVLQLKSEEDAIVADDVIASIEMAAGDSDGTDGATVAAGIHAIAEGTFSASANATKLVFTTGVSETAAASATAKMTLSSAGLLTIADDLLIKNSGTIGTAADSDLLTLGNGNLTVAGTVTATAGSTLLIKDSGGSTVKTVKGIS
jgi:hypothetical protein